MPVGIGSGREVPAGRVIVPARTAGSSGFHPFALWIAAGSPVAATLLLLSRLAV